MNWTQRVHQLLAQLEERARQCPGLYPVQASADFQRIVSDHLESDRSGNQSVSSEETALCLEELWRNPEFSIQLNAQSLIRRGASPFSRVAEKAPVKEATG